MKVHEARIKKKEHGKFKHRRTNTKEKTLWLTTQNGSFVQNEQYSTWSVNIISTTILTMTSEYSKLEQDI